MDYELRAAKEKWEREQREKKERARQRADRERRSKEEAVKRQQAIEAAQSARRLEEAGASLQAQHREEEAAWLGDGVVFSRDYVAVLGLGNGDKLKLPGSAFAELSSQNALDKGPMFFRVSVASESATTWYLSRSYPHGAEDVEAKCTHSGVLEFTAVEGSVELPPHVWRNAGLADSDHSGVRKVNVCYVRLQKGTYAKLQPQNLDFLDVPNHKAVLETKLRHHASLSTGDSLTVQNAGVDYELKVLELKPSSSVSVLETDLEVDIVGSAAENIRDGKITPSRLHPIELGKALKGVVSEGEYKYYKFSLDKAVGQAAADGECTILVHLTVAGGSPADADIYVGTHPLLFPTQHNHQWSSHDKGSKVVVMKSSGSNVGEGAYSIGVYGYTGTTYYQLLVEVKQGQGQEPSGQRVGSLPTTSSSDGQQQELRDGFEKCGNCGQGIPQRTLLLHEAYCRRHNAVCTYPSCRIVLRKDDMEKHVHCEKCGQALTKDELGKHMKIFHELLKCECGATLEMEQMVGHKASSCRLRQITCRFCGDMVQAGSDADDVRDRLQGLTQHESSCGSRTAPCDLCGRAVMLKEMDLHTAAAHGGLPHPEEISHSSRIPVAMESRIDSQQKQLGTTEEMARTFIECPICSKQFDQGATRDLNDHVDREHLTSPSDELTVPMQVDSPRDGNPDNLTPHTSRRTLSVACPICGMAVHSERDLSFHIDMVH